MAGGKSTVMVALGGNLAVAMPDPQRCFEAVRKLDLAVHIATKPNRSHLLLVKHNILLPCLGRTELDMQAGGAQPVTVEDSMSMVHASKGGLPPPSEHVRSEPAIVAGLAKAVLGDRFAGAYYPEANVLISLAHHDARSGTPAYELAGSRETPVSEVILRSSLPCGDGWLFVRFALFWCVF